MAIQNAWPGPVKAEPDFSELLKVLRRQPPSRPVLGELFMNGPLYDLVIGPETVKRIAGKPGRETVRRIHAFRALGYDYATVAASDFGFPRKEIAHANTISLNEGTMISDRPSFERYPWPDPESFPLHGVEAARGELPDGMKLIVIGPCGVLENLVRMVGYETLCMLTYDDPELVGAISDAIGSRLVKYYQLALQHDYVGAIWANDDWGFKTQTMLAPEDMRKYIVPWHRRIAEAAHAAGRPCIMHSCGRLHEVTEDIIGVIGHDGKHSYEDAIEPVEQAYERLAGRIAVIGGIDVDFVCRSTPQQVHERSRGMIERSRTRGGYALGTGNSVPEYVPLEKYFAMISAVNRERDDTWAAWAEELEVAPARTAG
ncbi:MAG TPA: uroporphyrinogen decarboxylase family protein [Planctomycetota bacterium]|nr:uroporphyrinogen decarboxylase family protein [Planctomycetota bacterium]